MQFAPLITRWRRRRSRPSLASSSGFGCGLTFTLALILALFATSFAYTQIVQGLPSPEALSALLSAETGVLTQPTRLYDRNGLLLFTLADPAAPERIYLTINQSEPNHLPQFLIQATLASTEPGFWSSLGYTLNGLGSAEHPTLAQRLVFDFLLLNEKPSLARDVRERLLAGQIVQRYGRPKVLEWYLNYAAYGPLIYGAQAAAQVYFNKNAADLSLDEAAFLAALAENPGVSPYSLPTRLLERQKAIIQAMLALSMISPDQAVQASRATLALQEPLEVENPSPAFNNLVIEQAAAQLGKEQVRRGGLRIITTLDSSLQAQASCAASAQLMKFWEQSEGQPADLPACQAARLLPTLSQSVIGQSASLKAGVVILDPHNGQILAMTGNPIPGQDPAHRPGRNAGTLLSPFIYLAAFSRGFTPATLYWDVPYSPGSSDAEERAYLGPLRLRTALANDITGASQQLLTQIGQESVLRTLAPFGLSGDPNWLSSSAEPQDVTLLQAVQAYATLANEGVMAGHAIDDILHASALIRVERSDGAHLLDWSQPDQRPVVSAQLAYLVNHILSDEAARWLSLGRSNALEVGRPAAAKMGSTRTATDGWTIGYTPDLIVGVWLGAADQTGISGLPQAAAGIWHALLQVASQDQAINNWKAPAGITPIQVCANSGMLPTSICPSIVSEIFINGTEPTQADTLYQLIEINRESGLLATVFTPPELVEKKIYMVPPPEAMEWALQAGITLPPDTYDVISTPLTNNAAVQITSPSMFTHVRGSVTFAGQAAGDNFSFYRLQVGQGLNPSTWLQIGEDNSEAVKNGALGEWDTRGLSGLYAVQLLVVRQDQRVERAIIQVTVDNEAPEIKIISPAENQEFEPGTKTVVLQARASDNLELAAVEFLINGRQVGLLRAAPYTLAWQSPSGQYTLRARVTDLAGNLSEQTLSFTVK